MGETEESANLWEFREGLPAKLTIYNRIETLYEDLAP